MSKQYTLHPSLKATYQFGGELLENNPKEARPIAIRVPMHTTFRSNLAKGPSSLLLPQNAKFIRALLKTLAVKFGLQVYNFSINSNHIHLLTRAASREGYKSFLRAFSGAIAMKITGAKKGVALAGKFWAHRPWSRIVSWGKSFDVVRKYILRNTMESMGQISYTPRKNREKKQISEKAIDTS